MADIDHIGDIEFDYKGVGQIKYEVMEIWKDIECYEGIYQVSNYGRVKVLQRMLYGPKGGTWTQNEYVRKLRRDSAGYLQVVLNKDGKAKSFSMGRLVATHFIPNPDNLPEVNHIDLNQANNRFENLEWSTRSQNQKHAWDHPNGRLNRKLNEEKAYTIKVLLNIGEAPKSIAERYGISRSFVSEIKRGKVYGHVKLEPSLKTI